MPARDEASTQPKKSGRLKRVWLAVTNGKSDEELHEERRAKLAGEAQPAKKRKKSRWQDWGLLPTFFVIGVILILMPLFRVDVKDQAKVSDAAWSVGRDLGVAFIVAVVVGLSVERAARQHSEDIHEEQKQDIQQNVFQSSFGIAIDPVVLDELYRTVFRIKFMRSELKITHHFARYESKKDSNAARGDLIELTTTVKYRITNKSKEPALLPLNHYFEVLYPKDLYASKYTALCVTGPDGQWVTDLEDFDFIDCNEEHKECNHHLHCCLSLNDAQIYKPHPKFIVPPGKFLNVQYTRKTIKQMADLEIYVTTIAADGMSVEAIVEDSMKDASGKDKLEFFTDASHRDDPKRAVTLPGILRWEIKAGVLPSQGIMLFWKPAVLKQKSTAQNADSHASVPAPGTPAGGGNGTNGTREIAVAIVPETLTKTGAAGTAGLSS